MKAFLEQPAKWVLERISNGRRLIHGYRLSGRRLRHSYGLRIYLEEIGWFRSAEEGLPVDRHGNPLPWYTYPAISFLSGKILSHMTVFEYGSGNSTFWWSKRVSSLTSCEHDPRWYNSLKNRVSSNVEYLYRELDRGGEYSRVILEYKNRFNIIVIDGRDRVNCAKNSLQALRDDGVIIWDDTERDRYQEGCSYLMQNDFRRLDFDGLAPIVNFARKRSTSIFYRDNNCFGI